jgi:circadian clock protein KaiB
MPKYVIKIYTGKDVISMQTIKALKEALKDKKDYQIKIIDVLKNPEMAEKDNVIVTPTTIKELPLPIKRLIGQLSTKKVLMGFEVVK